MRPTCHSSGGTAVTHEPLLHTRDRKDNAYPGPEPNRRRNCANTLARGMAALGLCVHSQPRAPASHHHALPPRSNTATHLQPTSARRAASPPPPLKPLVSAYRRLELLLAACRRVLHALVQHLLPLQSLHDLSLILPQFVCGLCPASRHTELSLYSYRPPTRGCLGPRAHSLPLPSSVQPPPQCAALAPFVPPRGHTLRFGIPNVPHFQTTACVQKWTPSPGPAHRSLPGPALQEARLLCPHGARVLLATGKVPRLQGGYGDQSTGGRLFLAF